MARKPHTRVPQHDYLVHLEAHGPTTLRSLAHALDVSETTARRNLDGLLYQHRVALEPALGKYRRSPGDVFTAKGDQ